MFAVFLPLLVQSGVVVVEGLAGRDEDRAVERGGAVDRVIGCGVLCKTCHTSGPLLRV